MADHAAGTPTSSMPRNSFVIAAVTAVLLALAWAAWKMEWIEQQSDPFFSDAANQNPYLAAQLFLERLHYAVNEDEDEDALARLPEGKVVTLLISGRAHLSEERQHELLRWISDGGHLITLANREWNEKTESIDDILQRQFDVAAVRTADNSVDLVNLLFDSGNTAQPDDNNQPEDDNASEGSSDPDSGARQQDKTEPENNSQTGNDDGDKNADQQTASTDDGNDNDDAFAEPGNAGSDDETAENGEAVVDNAEQCPVETPAGATSIEWFDGQQLLADIGGKMRIEIGDIEPTISAADSLGLQFVQFHYGLGKVTFLSSMSLWSNRQLSNFDNAHLLALLAGDADRVIILHDFDAVPLTELLKHFFPATLIMLVVFIAMIIFHFQQRWGSLLDSKAPPRRSLHEHIVAGGRLLWRHRQLDPMIRRQQQLITEQLQRSQHNAAPLGNGEIQKLLAAQTGIALEQIRIAMGQPATAADELLNQIRLLQSIRNSL